MKKLKNTDREIFDAIKKETKRQAEHIELIASENFVSDAVLEALGSVMTNKYAEGYPGKRYYGGCENVDVVEQLAIDRVKELFGAKFANVQPHSGSQANAAAYQALLKPGDKILGMDLNAGGHLSHGFNLSFSGIVYEPYFYGVNEISEELDYYEIKEIVNKVKPKLIIAGGSAYSREIDFSKFREIADEVGAYLMVDMAHIAGLVATGLHMSPFPYADVVTSTTHKTLRGPRGGIILTNNPDIAKKIDRSVFPGTQGGPLMNTIAAKAVAFKEALHPSFKSYQELVQVSAKKMAERFEDLDYRIVSGGTDTHLFTVDVKQKWGITGAEAEEILGKVNITVNKNMIPFDKEKPMHTSGIRIGTPAMVSKGFDPNDFVEVVRLIDDALRNRDNLKELEIIKEEVISLTQNHTEVVHNDLDDVYYPDVDFYEHPALLVDKK